MNALCLLYFFAFLTMMSRLLTSSFSVSLAISFHLGFIQSNKLHLVVTNLSNFWVTCLMAAPKHSMLRSVTQQRRVFYFYRGFRASPCRDSGTKVAIYSCGHLLARFLGIKHGNKLPG